MEALERQPSEDFIGDGEIVAFENGITSFSRLQRRGRERVPVFLYLFDLPRHEGEDLRPLPLRERKARLRRALEFGGPLRFNPHRNGEHGEELYRDACERGLEGVIAKRADSPYRSGGRSRDWLKLKCHAEQELVIGGYTAPKGSRTEFGALLVGYYDESGALRYAGKVGTGFDQHTLRELGERLRELEQDELAVRAVQADPAGHALGAARAGRADRLRRVDARRPPAPPALPGPARRQARPRRRPGAAVVSVEIEITHPDKLLFPDDGITKADLADYYERVAEWMLPHVKGRPVSMQRFPDGIDGKGFFHKDVPDYFPAWIRRVEVPKANGTVTHLVICDAATLVYLVGQNTITPHVWLSRDDRVWQPDRLVIDLDPPPGGDFAAVRRAARWTRRADARARVLPVRAGHGLEGHPRVDAAAPARRLRGRARARPRHRSRAGGHATRTSSRPSSARRTAASASWWTRRATATRRRPCRRTRSVPAPVPRWRLRSSGMSCPTRGCARTAGTSATSCGGSREGRPVGGHLLIRARDLASPA